MPFAQKLKLSDAAKNFNVPNKTIQEILKNQGIAGKTPSSMLELGDLNVIFEYLSQNNQVSDIENYMYDKSPVAIAPPEAVQEAKNKAKPASKPAGTQAQKSTERTAAQESRESADKSKANTSNNKPSPQKKEVTEQLPVADESSQNVKAEQANQSNQASTSKRDFSKPAFNQSNKPKPKSPQNNNQNNNAPKGGGTQAAATIDIISADNTTTGVRRENTKIVDTKGAGANVDLAKYDEKFTSDVDNQRTTKSGRSSAGSRDRDNRQKGGRNPRQDNRPQYGNRRDTRGGSGRNDRYKDKEQIALEKLRKQKLEEDREKGRKKQLSITLPEEIIVSDLASKLRVTSAEVMKKMFLLGITTNVNEPVDYDTAALTAMEFGAKVEKEVIITIEDKLFDESADADDTLVSRAPVVVIMGHVDHGKTSLLDTIKNTNVVEGEAGGITQHIGAYRVNLEGRDITFLDTPGHAAFTAMRARGAQATDIAIIVVAADDGVMPQTVEAINHAKAAGVSIIVAINKMDKPQADPERVKSDLTVHELVPEDWGGDIICVPVSAHTREGIDELLEMILLTADMKDLKANPNRLSQGIIIEAKLDKGRGPVATVLIQNGTLNMGDIVIAGTTVGRVRAMTTDRGEAIQSAGPSMPVEVIGLSETPSAGDMFRSVEDERMARELAERRKSDEKEELFKSNSNITLDDLFAQVQSGVKELNLIIKADVQGSVEALKASLIKESTEEVKIKPIHSAVGGITESDIMLADASGAIVIGFNVRPDKTAIDAAERRGVDVRTYRVIYDCIEEINAAMKGLLAPKFREVILGHAQVRQTIRVSNVGTIAGSYVQDGKIARNAQIRIVRDGIVIFEDKIDSLRRFKDDVREVAQGFECGIGLERFNDIKEMDILEAFIIEQIQD